MCSVPRANNPVDYRSAEQQLPITLIFTFALATHIHVIITKCYAFYLFLQQTFMLLLQSPVNLWIQTTLDIVV